MRFFARTGVAVAGAVVMAVVAAGPAAAHYCTNESNAKAANVAWALFTPGFDLVAASDNVKLKGEKVAGAGFFDLYIDVDGDSQRDPEELMAQRVFLHAGLPLQALTAGGCGKGVSTAFFDEFGIPDPCAQG